MEFPAHLSEDSRLLPEEPGRMASDCKKNKRPLSSTSEFPEELQSLKLRTALSSRFSFVASHFANSGTDLPSVSSGGEIDQLLGAYLHPSSETTSSPVILQSSSTSRSVIVQRSGTGRVAGTKS